MENIFEISNLNCSYDSEEPKRDVLKIEELNIPKGRIVFFVGPSGIGKSTILETLGLMNNTIHSVEKFKFNGKDKQEDLKDAWKWSDKKLSNFRNKNFSFIFQQTNLMPNFSAYDNVMITALFQGMSKEDATKKTEEVLEKMKLEKEDKPITNYSGGQRQRLAFARAIMPDFNVLFGDEPTGNLDAKSAENLMEILSEELHNKNITAIIVSHDMHLAVEYADMIVLINKKEDKDANYGVIDPNNIYIKENEEWMKNGKMWLKEDLKNHLIECLK